MSVAFWTFVAGLALFLYAMLQMEKGLHGLGSNSLTHFLRNQTQTPVRGIFSGALVTAFLQSSSLVGLIVLAFVGAGVLELKHALGVIFGANLGTTFTGWIVSLLGFKLSLDSLALPLITFGCLGKVFSKQHTKPAYISHIILGLGFLLFGLDYMKGSVEQVAENFNIAAYQGYPLIVFLLVGVVFTAVIQSSSATMIIVLSALNAQIIALPEAAALVIGADLGTTSTLLLGGMNGTSEKKRVAMAHLVFNVVTDFVAFLLLFPLLYFINHILMISDPLFSLVAFHSLFNVIGILLFIPFIKILARFLESLFKQQENVAACYIVKVPHVVAGKTVEPAIAAASQETQRLLFKVLLLFARNFKLPAELVLKAPEAKQYLVEKDHKHKAFDDDYSELKEIEGELLAYIYKVQNQSVTEDEAMQLSQLHHAVRTAAFAAKNIKDIRNNLADLRHGSEKTGNYHHDLQQSIRQFVNQFIHLQTITNEQAYQETLDSFRARLEEENTERDKSLFHKDILESMSDIQLSSLLHIHKTMYKACMGLLDAEAMTAFDIGLKPVSPYNS